MAVEFDSDEEQLDGFDSICAAAYEDRASRQVSYLALQGGSLMIASLIPPRCKPRVHIITCQLGPSDRRTVVVMIGTTALYRKPYVETCLGTDPFASPNSGASSFCPMRADAAAVLRLAHRGLGSFSVPAVALCTSVP